MIRWLAAVGVFPLLILAVLLLRPELDVRWEQHPAHFWLVLLAALLATVQEADRATLEALTRQADKTQQDLGRVLLARIDKKELPLDLARSFDAVKVKPGGVAGGGADAWTWQDVLAEGVSVGAPPDAFNSQGQDWGSPPLIPWRLRDADYEPFIQSIRATIAGAGGLRIDHVMGLFRLWWVPAGGAAAEGAYVRYPAEDLLDIVALESSRAQALVVGEDLGTVEDGVREAMAEHGILSYRLLWFEDDDPAKLQPRPPIVTGPKPLISAVTTAHATTTTHSSVLMAPTPRAGFAAPPARQGSRQGSGCPPA